MPDEPIRVRLVQDLLPGYIAALPQRAEAVVAKAALDIQANAQSRAPVDTGQLRASIRAHQVGPGHWRVQVGVDYGVYVEYGTIHMAPQPYLGPSVEQVRPVFMAAMKIALGKV